MKNIYRIIFLAAMAAMPLTAAQAVNPEELDVPEETWEMTYDRYQSLWDNSPEYKGLSHTVAVKKDGHFIYIKGILKEYPDMWTTGSYYPEFIILRSYNELSSEAETTEYFQVGNTQYVSRSANDREYTIGAYMKFAKALLWNHGANEEDADLLTPASENGSIWISSKPGESWSILRTYYFDGTSTGDDFDPQPIYLHPTFRKVTESGIMDAVTDRQQPEDTRVFDLSGRQVNPDRLTPGIYIRAGRKFIVH